MHFLEGPIYLAVGLQGHTSLRCVEAWRAVWAAWIFHRSICYTFVCLGWDVCRNVKHQSTKIWDFNLIDCVVLLGPIETTVEFDLPLKTIMTNSYLLGSLVGLIDEQLSTTQASTKHGPTPHLLHVFRSFGTWQLNMAPIVLLGSSQGQIHSRATSTWMGWLRIHEQEMSFANDFFFGSSEFHWKRKPLRNLWFCRFWSNFGWGCWESFSTCMWLLNL